MQVSSRLCKSSLFLRMFNLSMQLHIYNGMCIFLMQRHMMCQHVLRLCCTGAASILQCILCEAGAYSSILGSATVGRLTCFKKKKH